MSKSAAARYLPFVSVFTVVGSALVHAGSKRDPQPRTAMEFGEAALAAFFVARVVAKEKVGAVVREPFVEPAAGADPDDPRGEAKQPTGEGMRRTAGELITCTRCLGPWAGGLVTFSTIFAPRQARIMNRVLALAGANSFLQAGHAALCTAANNDLSQLAAQPEPEPADFLRQPV